VHHLISELVEYLINPERAFVNRFVRLKYVRIAWNVIFLDLFWHMKSLLDLLRAQPLKDIWLLGLP